MQKKKWFKNRWNTIRRWYVDEFCFQHIANKSKETLLLDIGGHKIKPMGQFNIMSLHYNRICFNITEEKGTDVLGDAISLPFIQNTFDMVVLSEVLEHVRDPLRVMEEVFKILKPGKSCVITVPFLYRVHADPHDYGRYTDFFWTHSLKQIGFEIEEIKSQGGYYSVLVDMLRIPWAIENKDKPYFFSKLIDFFLYHITNWAIKKDCEEDKSFRKYRSSYTTGFGIVVKKPCVNIL